MVSYWSTELQLAELGTIAEWRRRYRSLVHDSTRLTARNIAHVQGYPITMSELKQLLRAYSRSYFKVATRRAYFARCRTTEQLLRA